MRTEEERRAKFMEKLHSMSRDELEEFACNTYRDKSNMLLNTEGRKELDECIGDVIKKNLMDRVKKTDFVDKLLYQPKMDYKDNTYKIDYNTPQSRFNNYIESFLKECPEIQEQFKSMLQDTISKHMDNLVKNVIFRIFMNGLAKDVISTNMFSDAVNEKCGL